MSVKKTFAICAGIGLAAAGIVIVRLVTAIPAPIRGAVVTGDANPTKELPIADVVVTSEGGLPLPAVRTDASGAFTIALRKRMTRESPVTLHFRHPEYEPLDLRGVTADKLYIARMIPLVRETDAHPQIPERKIAHIVAQYSLNTGREINVGSAVKTFQVVNTANVPCGQRPCSPDGKWKAALGSVVIDAGPGNEFRNARASCIAGPCPFTRIDEGQLVRDRHTLNVSALNWSDTATFLVEAEVYKAVVNDVLLKSYPVIFDRALTFTLPASAESVSIEAEVDGTMIVFPLGPALFLSWARCQLFVSKDQTKVYRCELKSGYRFP